MPLTIEALFCDLALEREVLSAEELARCLARAGETGRVHAAAIELGVATSAQASRLYAAVYAALDARHTTDPASDVQCGACGVTIAARFALAYPLAPCPVCLADVDLVGRPAPPPVPIDEPCVETSDMTTLTALAQAVRAQVEAERAELPHEVAGMRVVERLPDRGVGAVYHVVDGDVHRVVRAIPRDTTAVDVAAVQRQYQRLAALEHPNIRPLAKVLRSKDQVFLVSAFHPGQDLDQLRARSGGRLRPQLVLKVAYQVARALEHAHKAGVLHGGITPGRILVGDDKRVLVLDFGLAPGAEAIAEYLVSGSLDGLPGYMSPEQCLGRGVIDARSDLFSLGLVMYASLAGGLPFGDDPPTAVYRQAHGEVPSIARTLPDLAPGIGQLVSRLVAREPDERYPDAPTLLRDLGYLMSGQAPTFARPTHVSAERIARGQRVQDARARATGERISIADLIERKSSRAASAVADSGATSEVVSAEETPQAPLAGPTSEVVTANVRASVAGEASEVVSAGDRPISVEANAASAVVSARAEPFEPDRTRPVPPPAPTTARRARGATRVASRSTVPIATPAPFEAEFHAAYDAGRYASALAILLARYDAEQAFVARWSYYRAACLWRVSRFDEALADLARVLAREPDYVDALFLRGLVHQARGADDLARADYAAVIARDPRHVKARCNRGVLLQAAGDHDGAVRDFKAALEVNPLHVRSLVGMGVVALERDQHELAEDFLDQALAIDPAQYLAVYAKARLAMRAARPREALAHLRHAACQRRTHEDSGADAGDSLRTLADAERDFAPLRESPKLRAHYRKAFLLEGGSTATGPRTK